jgi:transcriptional regulator with XRE-family HTH domain
MGELIAERRTQLKLSQAELAGKSRVSRATLDALENGRLRELGFTRVTRILTALSLELRLREAERQRPTLEDLRSEKDRD